ncbi:RNA 2'-phosphotransferase [Pleomorphomonas sp. JP5]|uniref:RNA 2'-phosphotransferase n=1 Tax=Pleomorphomonas sp. JP5 TaxID=2942998 RepID=UPI0020434CF5|nr:RNA 2'-phosphotransferase [Pleomorphomonas sp. JP5]MCM5557166.1 RNA 2'-phosphotransferase [Pleomorphomonas sp. JP5]
MDLTSLSRVVSHALRHEPWLYELELDEAGWVPVEALIAALRTESDAWSSVERADLAEMIDRSEKKRHELDGDRIRALYGHSTPHRLLKESAPPPAVLYHGTSPEAAALIREHGLMPMGRQYVHLSVDTRMADQVGRRKTRAPVILRIKAGEAHAGGVVFYRGNDMVWLADTIAPTFIE